MHTTRLIRLSVQKKGFSLMEVLVALAILLIIVAVVLQNFGSYAKTQQFKRFADEVGNNLKLVRQKTLASKDDTVYGVYVGTSTVEFFTGATPTPGAADNTIIDFSTTQFTATSSLTGNVWYLTFQRLTGQPTATGTISILSSELGQTATFTIYQSGLVE